MKGKGRRACQEFKDLLLRVLPLESDDIVVTSSGDTGEDLKLSPKARNLFPFVLEVKNQEKLNIWDAYKQAEDHWFKKGNKEELYPLVAFKRNRSDMMICMEAEYFLDFLYQRGKKKEDPNDSGIHLP